jgi:tetratricopeptide (TPR) repeat protein
VRSRLFWPRSRWTLALGSAACVGLSAVSSWAQVPISGAETGGSTVKGEPSEGGEDGARWHFDRALELYRAGRYLEALEELERAAKLDPDGKDLFFNLALVHEKLGQLPQAIAALERFRELETDGIERERARLTIERLRGAQAAAELARPTPCPAPAPAPAPPSAVPAPHALLIGTASVAVVSLAVGAVFGAKALSDDIGESGTSSTLSIAQLRERGQRAAREALVADIAFAVGAAAAGTFAGVWLLSPDDPTRRAAGITLRSYF